MAVVITVAGDTGNIAYEGTEFKNKMSQDNV